MLYIKLIVVINVLTTLAFEVERNYLQTAQESNDSARAAKIIALWKSSRNASYAGTTVTHA